MNNKVFFQLIFGLSCISLALPAFAGKKGKKRTYDSDSEIEITTRGISSTRGRKSARLSKEQKELAAQQKKQKRLALVRAHLTHIEDKRESTADLFARIRLTDANYAVAQTNLSSLAHIILEKATDDKVIEIIEAATIAESVPDASLTLASPQNIPTPLTLLHDKKLIADIKLKLKDSRPTIVPLSVIQKLSPDTIKKLTTSSELGQPLNLIENRQDKELQNISQPNSPLIDDHRDYDAIDLSSDSSVEPNQANNALKATANKVSSQDSIESTSDKVITSIAPKSKGKSEHFCAECNKMVTGYFKRHMLIHKPKAYTCAKCGSSFAQKDTLNGHIFTHTKERPYKCQECSKTFTRKNHLNEHILIHEGKAPTCNDCGKSFTLKKDLMRHEKIHKKEKPFPCLICGKGLSSLDSLRYHTAIHNGEKSFKCDPCGTSYRNKKGLDKHILSHP